MKRRLIVMRHAKSSWADPGQADHERPLNARGRGDAPRIGARIAELGWTPDAIWSSDAVRTRQTAELVASAFDAAPGATFDRGLYLGDLGSIRTSAAEWDEAWRCVLTLGHNPGWSEAASILAGRELGLTTANAVLLERDDEDATWADALLEGWRFVELLRPKEL